MFCSLGAEHARAQDSFHLKVLQDLLLVLLMRPFFIFCRAQQSPNISSVMRRHRENIFYPTCAACKDLDRRDSSAPLGMTEQCTMHDSRCTIVCHVERRGVSPEVETSRLGRTFAGADHNDSCRFTVEIPRFRCASLGMTVFCHLERSSRRRCHVERRGLGRAQPIQAV